MSFSRFHFFIGCIVEVVLIIPHSDIIVEIKYPIVSEILILLNSVVFINTIPPDFGYKLLLPFNINILLPGDDIMRFVCNNMIPFLINLE